MLRGNLYGLIIALLTFVIAIILTMRQVQESGIRVELIIQPINEAAHERQRDDDRRREVTVRPQH
jgi:hypothetical protein